MFFALLPDSIEEKILQKSAAKRMLEQLVIADGKFKGDMGTTKAQQKHSALAEAAKVSRLPACWFLR